MRHVVKITFIDKETGKGYTKGGMFESDDSERIATLVGGGFLVGVVEEDASEGGENIPTTGVDNGEIPPDGEEPPGEKEIVEEPATEDESIGEDSSETPSTEEESPQEKVSETSTEEKILQSEEVEEKPKSRKRKKTEPDA